ncbi:MAG: hypothetical protein ATN34_03595 [Epulopiscium sp. Nele67-Bin002]|nr:MAG: hypothetical protein BEN18_08495 [Epulopiscium sp. Nuni2H_MBin001]OON91370.1 MAG: hypothetical protein ATN34_03595 [Epulopiscium sp. Nele67-Bin002]OON93623.1 MAG: hypothetical protein ATN33_05550 [Epulopiscium sp. Nele67-Bin001]
MTKKVLVCITIQENSKRLLTRGAKIAQEEGAMLHILHVRKGATIFDTPNSPILCEELFYYGAKLGGETHFLCGDDIIQTVSDFIAAYGITNLVIGSPPENAILTLNILKQISNKFPALDIEVLERALA